MNSAMSLKDLRQFIDLADKFNLDEYAGAEGMYKLCYIIGNRLLAIGIPGLIFVGEVTYEMAHDRDANDEEREEHEQEAESASMIRRLTRRFRRISLAVVDGQQRPGLATRDSYAMSSDDEIEDDEQRHELPHHDLTGLNRDLTSEIPTGTMRDRRTAEGGSDVPGTAAAPEHKVDVDGSTMNNAVRVAPDGDEPGLRAEAKAASAEQQQAHRYHVGQEVMCNME